ncbi:hypothetical protein CERZMDRAFT_100093 [Cercospora zeae-maydis SCOH1-5]|uniref:Uncharacterized protein n=1 Tax=Cercospora zeae-maydis SCOH1-5 TaxID=717836 RepID=A0A6A6F815_9PEZI|nr:hypothetical protein CERZMDRAFT_100093 [Cercospora zeae-maydis SCOH1-5]
MRSRPARDYSLLLALCASLTKAQQHGLLEERVPPPQQLEQRDFWSDLQGNHIDAIANAAQELVNQKFPEETPTKVNLQTVAWPSTYQIGGTTYTAAPTTSASATSSESSSITSSTSLSTTTSMTATSTSSSSTTPTPTQTKPHDKKNVNDGDRKVAIALGVIAISAAVAAALLVLLAAWYRKRKTGTYFKPARCPECSSSRAPSILFGVDRDSGAWRAEHTDHSHSWLSGARNFGSVRSGGANSLRANFPEMTGSAERLPIPVEAGKATTAHQEFAMLGDSCSSRGTGRLQKSRPTTREGFIELHQAPPGVSELSGDDLNTINELEGETSSQRPMTRRLSSFPFMFSSSVRGGSDVATSPDGMASRSNSGMTRSTATTLGPIASRSNSGMIRTTASELGTNESSVRRRLSSVTRLSLSPVVMANIAGSKTNIQSSSDGSGMTVPDAQCDQDYRPSEMDGESPTRRASRWRELQRSTFTVDDLKAEVEGFNALLVSGSEGDTTSVGSSPTDMDDAHRNSVLSPSSTGNWSEVRGASLDGAYTAPTDYSTRSPSNASQSAKSSSSSADGSPIGYVSALRPACRPQNIKTTEIILPPRPPQVFLSGSKPSSIGSVSPVSTTSTIRLPAPPTQSERDAILSKLRHQNTSPRPTPAESSPAWAPAGAYAMAPIWRKKRPMPLTPEFLAPSVNSPRIVSPLPLHGSGDFGRRSPVSALRSSFGDLSRATTLKASDSTAYPSSEALVSPDSVDSAKKPRPRALEPDRRPETLTAGNIARQASVDAADAEEDEPQNDDDTNNNNIPIEVSIDMEEDPDSHTLHTRHDQYFRRCSRLDPGSPYSYLHASPTASKFQSLAEEGADKPTHYPTSDEIQKFSFDDGEGEFANREDGDDGWKPSDVDLEDVLGDVSVDSDRGVRAFST